MTADWFSEKLYPNVKISYTKEKLLYDKKSPFQRIQVFDNPDFGRMLSLDNIVQTTEKDEFIYHEMLTHPILLTHPNPKHLLIIGGGDGGVLREALRHKSLESIVLVEIDAEIPRITYKYMKNICKDSFRNKKADLKICDGAKFVSQTNRKFDVIIIDSSDPVGPAKILFKKRFYLDLKRVLRKNGIVIRQTGSTFFQFKEIKTTYNTSRKVFKHTKVSVIAMPTYIGGFFSLMYSSNKINPETINMKKLKSKYDKLRLKTKYYTPQIHKASFVLPRYMKERLG